NDFGVGKSSYVMNVKRAGRSLRPYSSVNEVNFYRGVGMTLTPVKDVEATIFGSYKPVDATLRTDTLENTDFDYFGTVRQDGYHRTESEISNKNSLYQSNAGLKVKYKSRKFEVGLNTLYTHFSVPLIKDNQLYKKYLFAGQNLINASIDYGFRWRNINLFGEAAISDNGGKAMTNGALISLDKRLDMSVVMRNFAPDFHSLNGNAFSESSLPINEEGIYMGFELRPARKFTLSAYVDFWSHPWLGYRRDGLADGKEFLIKLQYVEKRKLEFYIQYRYEKKYLNSSGIEKIDFPQAQVLQRLRGHLSYKLTKEWEIRDRIEMSDFFKGNGSRGYLMYQDIIFKPIAKPFSFNARFSIFDIQSFDARIYTYENDILYEFYIPFYQNKGTRFYVNTRYRLARNYTFELRYGRVYYENVNSIGSGNELINGNIRSEIKAQIKLKF
ncbi:MAG: helix-hairpin-helix domain-containing protein, partial [Saprospiraceae bacterium]